MQALFNYQKQQEHGTKNPIVARFTVQTAKLLQNCGADTKLSQAILKPCNGPFIAMRNATEHPDGHSGIHASKDRPIGDGIEFQKAVRSYLALLRTINGRLPYPDAMYEPRER
jgi:hypothetical protein